MTQSFNSIAKDIFFRRRLEQIGNVRRSAMSDPAHSQALLTLVLSAGNETSSASATLRENDTERRKLSGISQPMRMLNFDPLFSRKDGDIQIARAECAISDALNALFDPKKVVLPLFALSFEYYRCSSSPLGNWN